MVSGKPRKFSIVMFCFALATCNFVLDKRVHASLVDLGEAQRFLFLAQRGISEGGGSNSYIGDIAAPSMYGWNPVLFDGTIVDNEPVIAEAITDALEFSTVLTSLQPDITMTSRPPQEWHTVKPGLNVLNVLDYPDFHCALPQIIYGDEGDTVVVNVMFTGEVEAGIRVGGGLRPQNLIVNILNAAQPYIGTGSTRTAGTYLVVSGQVEYGAGSGGLDGAVISTDYINIDGGSNLFTHYPFDASAIPEPATLLLLGLGGLALMRRGRSKQ